MGPTRTTNDAPPHARAALLRELGLFPSLSEERLEALAGVVEAGTFPAGAVVFDEGDPGDALYLISDGDVRIEKRSESEATAGGYRELAALGPGEVFGEMALLEADAVRSARAVAATDATLFSVRRDALTRWLESSPQAAVGFFVSLLQVLSQRVRRTSADLIFLHDLSDLCVRPFDAETDLLIAVLDRTLPHLGEGWSCAAYLRGEFDDRAARCAAVGPAAASLPDWFGPDERDTRWLDDATTLRVALPDRSGAAESPVGFLVARSPAPLTPRDGRALESALSAVAGLLSGAALDIRHEAGERLRARLGS